VRDVMEFAGRGTSYLIESKIAVRRGVDRRNLYTLYDELRARSEFLKSLADRKVFNYFEVWGWLLRARQVGYEEAMRAVQA